MEEIININTRCRQVMLWTLRKHQQLLAQLPQGSIIRITYNQLLWNLLGPNQVWEEEQRINLHRASLNRHIRDRRLSFCSIRCPLIIQSITFNQLLTRIIRKTWKGKKGNLIDHRLPLGRHIRHPQIIRREKAHPAGRDKTVRKG